MRLLYTRHMRAVFTHYKYAVFGYIIYLTWPTHSVRFYPPTFWGWNYTCAVFGYKHLNNEWKLQSFSVDSVRLNGPLCLFWGIFCWSQKIIVSIIGVIFFMFSFIWRLIQESKLYVYRINFFFWYLFYAYGFFYRYFMKFTVSIPFKYFYRIFSISKRISLIYQIFVFQSHNRQKQTKYNICSMHLIFFRIC